ncbi:MAG TPA: serine hydrolase [Gemmataceae bacterium]|jgi:CubicO group peptidase (beta-lactamase class C family)
MRPRPALFSPRFAAHIVLLAVAAVVPWLPAAEDGAPGVVATLKGHKAAEAFQWRTATPESQGMSSKKLDDLKDKLSGRTQALLVIRNDRIVYEWYAKDRSATMPHYTASLAKALVGGMSLAVAITDSQIALDDPVGKFVPAWKKDAKKAQITIRHLGSHTSGLEDSSVAGTKHTEEPGWKGEFWKRLAPPHDPFTIARDQTPVLFEPGTRFQYSNPGIAMLTYAVTAAIRGSRHKDVRALLRERIMRPIGAPDKEWSIGYGQTTTVDGLPLVGAWGGGAYSPRTTARVGRLVLRKGDWEGRRLLSEDAVRLVTSDAGLPGHCGMGWWTNGDGRLPHVPRDAVWGAGAGHQILLVVPSLRLIVVRNGSDLFDRSQPEENIGKVLFEPILAAINDIDRSSAPYPPSKVITAIEWAPKTSIVRRAKGSDNWPLTWGDDDLLYTAYGDGNGFEPFVEKKLSLGLATISGGPGDFQGTNLRSSGVEAYGDGEKGEKASGLLMVDGVLALWVRNTGNSRLKWSSDRGKTWTAADWKWTASFGAPTFLNFGRNYAGARDEYLYVYSHDADSAYRPADRMVLARVRKDRFKERSAYEFFVRLDSKGKPQWTRDIARRGSVFSHAGKCYRSGITYNAALKRYLWCQILPHSRDPRGPRFDGGFGIYDAAEPWGPWTTVFYSEQWDVGPGETSCFPTKWMSADGRTVHLVFSGDDCFSVRRARLTSR